MPNDMKYSGHKNKYEDYEIESAADTLIRAEEIRKDEGLYKLAAAGVKKKADAANAAVDNSKMMEKVEKGLKKSFGSK